MNFEKYTDRARGFVQSAQSMALREGHQQFAPEHLLKVLLDDPEGLAAGLTALHGRADTAYLSSCDVPFLRPAFVQRMMELLGEHSICVPRVGGYHHPLAAVYRVVVVDAVRRLLASDRLRPVFLFEEVPTRVVEAEELRPVDPEFDSLRNLNTPEAYDAALVNPTVALAT